MPELGIVVFVDPRHADASAGLIPFLQRQRMDRTRFSISVADNAHDPHLGREVERICEADPSLALHHLRLEQPGRASALNATIQSLDCEYVWIVADDARPASTAAQAFLDFHAQVRSPLAAGIGAMVFKQELREDPFRRWLEDSGELLGMPLNRRFASWPGHFFYAGNVCVRRSLFEKTGWFDERFTGLAWDDYEFGIRWHAAGGLSQLLLQAQAYHDHWLTLEERMDVCRDAGQAAGIHEHVIGAQRCPWRVIVERAHHARQLPLPKDDPTLPLPERVPIFQAILNAAFLAGYESAPAQGAPPPRRDVGRTSAVP